MKFLAVPALLAAAFAIACGGGDASSGQPTGGGNGSAPTQAANSGDGATGGGSSNAGENTAVVTVGGERYEFTLQNCIQLGGALGAAGRATNGDNITFRADLPPKGWESSGDDWEAPSVSIRDNVRDVDWLAGGEVIEGFATVGEGQSQVDSYVVNGKRGSGTATFVNLYAVMRGDIEPVQGTFEFACE